MENKAILASVQKDFTKKLRKDLPKHIGFSMKINSVELNDNFEVGAFKSKVFTYCQN